MKNFARTSVWMLIIILFPMSFLQAQTLSPAEFLGYELGDRFTPHHRMVAYYEHVADTRNNVTLEYYGQTNQLRPLLVAFVTSPENQNRLDDIRVNNLRLAGLAPGEAATNAPAVTWMSYGIHGNESSSMEAAMQTIYELSDPTNQDARQWLQRSVVVIDPCVNPDGRDRYANWYNQALGRFADPKLETREHNEPWPGGRSNHYYFDLNRDWAWATQKESAYRSKLYQSWMPHIHADFHEMGHNAPYYFAPAAEPFHEDITNWQREFQTTIGKNHTRYFDAEGWLYYTRERFDLFYPSYGDTWPTFNGAIGMTYEKAGHSRAGTVVITNEGDTLTLAERVLHHHTVGLSTVEVTANHADRVVSEFKNYFDRAQSNPPGEYKTYIIKAGNHPDKVSDFLSFLDSQNIRYGAAPQTRRVDARSYRTSQEERISLDGNDIVISAYQPKSVMVKVLLEPRTTIVDSVTYDITSWSLPYAYGLEAYATTSRINPASDGFNQEMNTEVKGVERPYAYIAKWQTPQDAAFLSALLRNDIRVRFSEVPFAMGGVSYEAGTLVISRRGNERFGELFDSKVRELALKHHRSLHATATGYSDSGTDIGALDMKHLKSPKVAVIAGNGVNSLNYGEIWHFFDQQIGFPAAYIYGDNLNQVNWNDYDVLVLAAGNYNSIFDENARTELVEWIRGGGKVIAFQSAASFISRLEGITGITVRSEDNEKDDEIKLRRYADREREAASSAIRGGIYKLNVDDSHPLGFGYKNGYYTIKNSNMVFDYLDSGWNVFTLPENSWRTGYVGSGIAEHVENSTIFAAQQVGRGHVVVFADNPLFRAFWHNGKMIFSNAVFMVGQ